ncbi:MAG: hypothetical protein NUW09_01315 [Deltaproteobacteria bacterium]|nr:hypothetical protein [Deltaproteobacteria bacterium]
MPTEYEINLKAKRKADEEERQWMAFKRGTPWAMGQPNPYFPPDGSRGGEPTRLGMSALGKGFPSSSGLIKDKSQNQATDAAFIARYGMTPADMVEGYRVGKIQEGTTPGGPSTLFTGAQGLGTNGLPQEQGLDKFDVGRRFRDGQPVLNTTPETVKLTDEQKDLRKSYLEIQKRIQQLQENKSKALTYDERVQLEMLKATQRQDLKKIAPGKHVYGSAGGGISTLGGGTEYKPAFGMNKFYGPQSNPAALDAEQFRLSSKLSGRNQPNPPANRRMRKQPPDGKFSTVPVGTKLPPGYKVVK